MQRQIRSLAAAVALVALGGCVSGDREAGADVDGGHFGNATMQNSMAQINAGEARILLSRKFASEVPATITFPFNSASLTAESAAVLNQQANWMSQFPELRFSVYGHTDLVGSNAYNKALGRKRAETVVAYLAARGISRNRLQALVSYGETQPIVITEQPEMRNRRTVTEVSGFLQRQNAPLNGKYAAVIMREYVDSAVRPIKPPTNVQSQVVQGN